MDIYIYSYIYIYNIYNYNYIHLYKLYIYIYNYIFFTSRNSQSQQISPTDFKAKLAALDLFVDISSIISSSMRKQPIAINFDKQFLGEICCDWLITGYLTQETIYNGKFRQPILGRNLL